MVNTENTIHNTSCSTSSHVLFVFVQSVVCLGSQAQPSCVHHLWSRPSGRVKLTRRGVVYVPVCVCMLMCLRSSICVYAILYTAMYNSVVQFFLILLHCLACRCYSHSTHTSGGMPAQFVFLFTSCVVKCGQTPCYVSEADNGVQKCHSLLEVSTILIVVSLSLFMPALLVYDKCLN